MMLYHVGIAPWTVELLSEECMDDGRCDCCKCDSFPSPRRTNVELPKCTQVTFSATNIEKTPKTEPWWS